MSYITKEQVKNLLTSGEGAEILNHSTLTVLQLLDKVEDLPTADVVEMVRCKDCTNYGEFEFCDFMGLNGFCRFGERKENG